MGAASSQEAEAPSPARNGGPVRPSLGTRPGVSDTISIPGERPIPMPLFGSHRHDAPPPVAYLPPVERSGTSLALVLLRNDTLRAYVKKNHLHIAFNFEALENGTVSVYFLARPRQRSALSSDDALTFDVRLPARVPVATKFEKGAAKYDTRDGRGLPLHALDTALLSAQVAGVYPLVIVFEKERKDSEEEDAEDGDVAEALAVYAKLQRGVGDRSGWSVDVIKRDALVRGKIYTLQDLFGIGAVTEASEVNANSSGNDDYDARAECVICLTDACTTAVKPCNHLCLCDDCADALRRDPAPDRRRCPVCRGHLKELLRFAKAAETKEQQGTTQQQQTVEVPAEVTRHFARVRISSKQKRAKEIAHSIDDTDGIVIPLNAPSSTASHKAQSNLQDTGQGHALNTPFSTNNVVQDVESASARAKTTPTQTTAVHGGPPLENVAPP